MKFLATDKTNAKIPEGMTEKFPVKDSQELINTATTDKELEPDEINDKENSSITAYLTARVRRVSVRFKLTKERLSYTDVMHQRWVAAGQIPLKERSSTVSEYE